MMDQEFSGQLKDTRAVQIHFMELPRYVALLACAFPLSFHIMLLSRTILFIEVEPPLGDRFDTHTTSAPTAFFTS